MSATHDALRLLREEHGLQANMMQKLDKQVALFESEERVRYESIDPSIAKDEPKLVDLHGAGGEGTRKQQLLQKQQLPQSPRLQEEQQSKDCCACDEKVPPPPIPPPLSPVPPLPPSSIPPQPPPSPMPPLSLPPQQHRRKARPISESVAHLFCTRQDKRT